MSQRNDNFVDKTFTVLADMLLKLLPATKEEKEAFSYYRVGMSLYASGEHHDAMRNYYEALKLEEDPHDRSYILYNVGLIYTNSGRYSRALKCYEEAIELNPNLPQALNNAAAIYHKRGVRFCELREFDLARGCFRKARVYWSEATSLFPNAYIEAQNWLTLTSFR
jgi:tetratricopeptide (TPR) repeat protein